MAAERSQTSIEIERWFRYHGLPYLVRPRRWASELNVRVVPFLMFVTLAGVALTILDVFPNTYNDDELLSAMGYIALWLVFVCIVPAVISVFTAGIIRRRPRWKQVVAPVLIFVLLVVDPFVITPLVDGAIAYNDAWFALCAGLAVYLLTWLGVGSLLGWAARTAAQQYAAVGTMAARALPLLTIVVLLSMFSGPLWTTADNLTNSRMFAVIAFFLVIGIAFVSSFTRGELHTLSSDSDPQHVVELLRGTPAEGMLTRRTSPQLLMPASRVRFNLRLTLTVTLLFQVFVLASLVFFTLLIFGTILIGPEVVEKLTGHPPVYLDLLGISTPFIAATSNMALFLSSFSGLQFIIQVGTNREQKETYYVPLIRNARTALAVELAYRNIT